MLHLIDRLEELIGEARRLPIGTGSVIDRRRLLDLVDQLRAAVPTEVREAQEILERKEGLLAETDEEAALRLSRADEEVERRISESEIARAAQTRADQIIAASQSETERLLEEAKGQAAALRSEGERLASEQMEEADRYALEMLVKLDQQLGAFSASVRAGIETLDHKPAEPFAADVPPAAGAPLAAEPEVLETASPAAPPARDFAEPPPVPKPSVPKKSPFTKMTGVSMVRAGAPADEDAPLPVASASPGADVPPAVDTPPERDEPRSFEEAAAAPPLIPAADPPAADDATPNAADDLPTR